jgi:hypothetical protein
MKESRWGEWENVEPTAQIFNYKMNKFWTLNDVMNLMKTGE